MDLKEQRRKRNEFGQMQVLARKIGRKEWMTVVMARQGGSAHVRLQTGPQ